MQVKIKKASTNDSDFLFLLRNERDARKNSFTTTTVKEKDHKKINRVGIYVKIMCRYQKQLVF